MTPDDFITKWTGVPASELSTSQSFLLDLCHLLEVPTPHPTPDQDYMFERPITFAHGDGSTSAGRIDLYRRNAFVLESKRLRGSMSTKGFDDAMLRARSQAESYARALDPAEGRPPFLVVVDVGHRLELYSEFSRSGATYTPFPDPSSHRIRLEDLRKPGIIDRLKRLWLDPMSLDPSRESARVTREIAINLADLARSLEADKHAPEDVAQFLMRCLFTMFAEDVRLLPPESFRGLLITYREDPPTAMAMVGQLWRDMDVGGFSAVLAKQLLQFNGMLFKTPTTLPLDRDQIDLLAVAAGADWKHVEPAIFGTLLERALAPTERHKLGAHYTPRAYVERLILPTVIEPLRAEWNQAQAAALTLAAESKLDDAVKELLAFHKRLCQVRVLDPACGSGNFLYVTLEHLKRLEGEVLNALDEMGYRQTGLALDGERADVAGGETVDPHNLLGIELNPRAAAIAEVVLWIGYLQWHYRTRGDVNPPIPVIRDFRNIENRDAVLAYDNVVPVTDSSGNPLTRWDGVTMKLSAVTGAPVPDEAARKPVVAYTNPRKAAWPKADFVVGNPPFIGNKRMRTALGDGYVEALRRTWPEVPESADLVMFWWHHAAQITRHGALEAFGLITTNSIRQSFNRRVIEPHLSDKKQPLSLSFAIPDHPWMDGGDGAAVRIAMTVGVPGLTAGLLSSVVSETDRGDEIEVELHDRTGKLFADLRVGADVAGARQLQSNLMLSNRGVIPHGEGMTVTAEQAAGLGLGSNPDLNIHIRPYRNGRDITQSPRGMLVIDLYGLQSNQVRDRFPALYQWLLERVKPERDAHKDKDLREKWWLHRRNNEDLRRSLQGLDRYIATVQTSKHHLFVFLDASVLPDDKLIAVASDDALHLGILSSQVHATWALASGATLEDRPVYNKSSCFEAFPFPDLHTADKFGGALSVALDNDDGTVGHSVTYGDDPSERIRDLADKIDTHRKRQQAEHAGLTLTGMYNVLECLRSGGALSANERTVHDKGLVSILRQLHDELDEAVLYAYGWGDLVNPLRVAHGNTPVLNGDAAAARAEAKREFDDAVLERLVALNAERAGEEARGHTRWLRPDFQKPDGATVQPAAAATPGVMDWMDLDAPDTAVAATVFKAGPWPKQALEQVRAVADILVSSPIPLSEEDIAARFTARGAWKKRLHEVLGTLVTVGNARLQDGRYAPGR